MRRYVVHYSHLKYYLGNLPHCWNVYYLAVNNITIQHHADVEHTPPRARLVRGVLGDDLALAEHLSNGALADCDISEHDNVGRVDWNVFIVSDVVADAGNHGNTTEGGKVLVQGENNQFLMNRKIMFDEELLCVGNIKEILSWNVFYNATV